MITNEPKVKDWTQIIQRAVEAEIEKEAKYEFEEAIKRLRQKEKSIISNAIIRISSHYEMDVGRNRIVWEIKTDKNNL